MSTNHQGNEDDDDEDFLLTPRARDRFRQGYSQYPQGQPRRPDYPSYNHNRPNQRPQGGHSSKYASQRSYNEYGTKTSYGSNNKPYRDSYSRSSSYERHYSQNEHHSQERNYRHYSHERHYSQQPSYKGHHFEQRRDHIPYNREHHSHSSHSRLKETGRREADRNQHKPDSSKREHSVTKGPSENPKGSLFATSSEKHSKIPPDKDKLPPFEDPHCSSSRRSEPVQAEHQKNTDNHKIQVKEISDQYSKKQKISPRSETWSDSKAGFKKSVSELLNETENRSSKKAKKRLSLEKHENSDGVNQESEKTSKTDKIPEVSVHDGSNDTARPDKGHDSNSNPDHENRISVPTDKTRKNHVVSALNESNSEREKSDVSRKSSEETKSQKIIDSYNRVTKNTDESVDTKRQSNKFHKISSSDNEPKPINVENIVNEETYHCNPVQISRRETVKNLSLSKFPENSGKEINKSVSYSSAVDSSKDTENIQSKGGKYVTREANPSKSGTKFFADSSGGLRMKSKTKKITKYNTPVLASETEHKVSAIRSGNNKDKKFAIMRQISDASASSVESCKTVPSGAGFESCSQSERKTGSEMPTFDFAGDIFQDIISNTEAKTSKLKSDKLVSTGKGLSRAPTEQFKDQMKNLKKIETVVTEPKTKYEKDKQKKTAMAESDSSGSDQKFEHFKNILTQVHDSRWKTKPLKIESRRSSTQSQKSTDSSASVSLLNPPLEIKVLSQKAYRKFGVRNIEYKRKKIYYKGIRIKQPVIIIRKKDIRNVIEHKKMLKLQKKLDKTQKFKRIKRIRSSSPESEIRDSDSDNIASSSAGDQLRKGSKMQKTKEFTSIVPDSHEDSDTSQHTDKWRISHTVDKKKTSGKVEHEKDKDKHNRDHKILVNPKREKKSGVNKKEGKLNAKMTTKNNKCSGSEIKIDSKLNSIPDSKNTENKHVTAFCKSVTQIAAKEISNSLSSSDESGCEITTAQDKTGTWKATKLDSSPVFSKKVKDTNPVSKALGNLIGSVSSNSNDLENQTVKSDLDRNAIIKETESSDSSDLSDTLLQNTNIDERQKLSLAVKPCEVALTILDRQTLDKITSQKDSSTKQTTGESVEDLREVPETQMSCSSSSEFPCFIDSPADSENDKTLMAVDKCVENNNVVKEDIVDITERNKNFRSNVLTSETKPFSSENPVSKNDNKGLQKAKNTKKQSNSILKDPLPNNCMLEKEEEINVDSSVYGNSENMHDKPGKMSNCAAKTEISGSSKQNTFKQNLSPQDKIKHSFSSFRNKLIKHQQKQRKERKLKSKIISKKLRDRGLLSDKDETGEEGDVEDNLVIESLSDSDDSDLVTQISDGNRNVQRELIIENENIVKNSEAYKNNSSPGVAVQSVAENKRFSEFEKKHKESINIPPSVARNKTSESDTNSTTQNNKENKSVDTSVKEEPISDDDGVEYESFTSSGSCKQSSGSSDHETEKENVVEHERKEMNEKLTFDPSGSEFRRMSLNENKQDINQQISDSNAEPEVSNTNKKSSEDGSIIPASSDNHNFRIKLEKTESEHESSSIKKDNENEPVQIKEEPDWSKFSYSQEPDTIFVSDSDDNGVEIMSAQNETIVVNSDSDSDKSSPSQFDLSSLQESQVMDPEFWDFSSPEVYSSSDDDINQDIKSNTTEFLKNSEACFTDAFVKQEKIETEDKHVDMESPNYKVHESTDNKIFSDDTVAEKLIKVAENESIENSYSGSESSYDESEFVELSSSDSENEANSTSKCVHNLGNSPISPQSICFERQHVSSASELYTTSTVKDSFDPYAFETQVEKSPLADIAISESNKSRIKLHSKYLHENISENEILISNNEKSNTETDHALYEACTQVDKLDRCETEGNSKIREDEQTISNKEAHHCAFEQENLETSDSLSDSSLVDAADTQIGLYKQTQRYHRKRNIVSVAGLLIKYDVNAFDNKKEGKKIKQSKQSDGRMTESPVSNKITETAKYAQVTQVGTLNADKESSSLVFEIGGRKSPENVYSVHTQKTSIELDDSVDELKSRKDIYSVETQIDTAMNYSSDSDNHSDSSKRIKTVERKKAFKNSNNDYDSVAAYGALTQVDTETLDNNRDIESEKEDEIDVYADMTQVDSKSISPNHSDDELQDNDKVNVDSTYVISSESENEEYYSMATQVDKKVKNEPVEYTKPKESVYDTETQSIDENQGTTDISLISLTDSDQFDKNAQDKHDEKSHAGKAVTHPDVPPVPSSIDRDDQNTNRLNMIRDKLKKSLNEKKTIEIPAQKVRSWKMGRQVSVPSSVLKFSSQRNDSTSVNVSGSGPKTMQTDTKKQASNDKNSLDDIALHDAKTSDMWLSKNVSKPTKISPKPLGRRKRRATGESESAASFRSAVEGARKQLADRNYQTIFQPKSKADTIKKPKLDAPSAADLDDVDLPTCSQIVSKGLPILNQTDILVKKNKPQQQPSSRFSSRAASLTESMVNPSPSTNGNRESDQARKTTSGTKSNKTKESAPSSSAFEFLEKEIRNLQHSEADNTDKVVDGKAEETVKHRKRRLSKLSEKNEYMPETKSSKTETGDGSIPHTPENMVAGEENSDTNRNIDQNSKPKDNPSSVVSIKSKTTEPSVNNVNLDKRPSVSKSAIPDHRTEQSNEGKQESVVRADSQSGNKEASERRPAMTDKTNISKKSPGTRPHWNMSSIEKEKQNKTNDKDTEKAKKKVTFSENIRVSVNDSSNRAAPSQKLAMRNTPRDPRLAQSTAIERPNLMLKTSLQNPTASRIAQPAGTIHPQSRPAPQLPVVQTRQNQGPVPATGRQAPGGHEKGISFKEFLAVMLRWNPVWFEEHAKHLEKDHNGEPPNCINGLPGNPALYPLPEKYNNFKEYSDNFMIPLLLYETWESCFRTLREKLGRNTLLKHLVCPSGVTDAGDRLNEYVLIGLLTEREKRQNPFFMEGDLVILDLFGTMMDENNKHGEQKLMTQMGLVEKVIYGDVNVNRLCASNVELAKKRKPDSFSVRVILKTRKRRFTPDYNRLGELMQVGSVVTTLRQFKALENLPRNPLCQDILWPTNNETYCDILPQTTVGLPGDFSPSNFNLSQQRAIMTASQMVSRPSHMPKICLLQGPPGTGKSHTILGIINKIMKDKQQKARICLCAQSHAAIDELLRRLNRQNKVFKQKGQSTVNIVRLGKPSSVHEDVRYLCLEKLVEKNVKVELTAEKRGQLPQSLLGEKESLEKKIKTIRAEIKNSPDLTKKKLTLDLQKLERQRENIARKCEIDVSNLKPTAEQERKVKNNVILNAHVIAGTLNGIGSSVLKQYFEWVGKENRKQGFDCIIIDEATQAIELDTLIPLQYGTTKLILVGDPEQLPPTVVSQVAVVNRFNLSLFERLDSHFRYSNHNPVIMLDTQYRMDPEICSFPNNYIYDGKLKTDGSINRSQCPLVPYLLYDIADGREQLSQCSGSVSNPVEALFTVKLVEFITGNTNVTAKVIGIIAPYQKQKSLLISLLAESPLNCLREIEVSTVDGFQGREKHVIIMSCVRANLTGTVGFVGNRNRMNVSLTRAKYALYVVAHFDSLERSEEWKPLIEDADKRKRRVKVTEQTVEQALAKCLKRNHHPPVT